VEGLDDTAAVEARNALQSGEFYRRVLEEVDDGVYVLDRDRHIIYWNKGAERITGFPASEVLGRACRDNIVIHVDGMANPLCSGACPARIAMQEDRECQSDVYLHHKLGHRVPIHTRIVPLKGADGRVVGGIEVFTDDTSGVAARQRLEELERLSLLDFLTGLGNRRHAEVHLRARLQEYDRYGWRFGLLYFDIDHFKLVNDTFGHDAGDDVLKMVAATTGNAVRSIDMVSRWGGEEFTAIIANVGEDELRAIAEKLRALVSQSMIVRDGAPMKVTVSVGATLVLRDDTIETLVKRADGLMYQGKESGRNRVVYG